MEISTKAIQSNSSESFCGLVSESSLNSHMERFWQINKGDETRPKSIEDLDCEKLFSSTTTRDHDGRLSLTYC